MIVARSAGFAHDRPLVRMFVPVSSNGVFHWNPVRRRFGRPGNRLLALGRRVDNFGDLLGPLVVGLLLGRHGFDADTRPASGKRILSVGSILHFADTADVVWGSGVNGKISPAHYDEVPFRTLDVRAVRGPLTRRFLQDRGVDVPPIYGDPALLLPSLRPGLFTYPGPAATTPLLAPNLHDVHRAVRARDDNGRPHRILAPTMPVAHCLQTIAASPLVIASSLHAIVIAEALGIATRVVLPPTESRFKYDDHFRGTGRPDVRYFTSFDGALDSTYTTPPIDWDPQPLLDAFPVDQWHATTTSFAPAVRRDPA